MLTVPIHQSTEPIYIARGGAGSGYQSASAFVSNRDTGLAQGLDQLARGVDKFNQVSTNIALQERQNQLEMDLLRDMQDYQSEAMAWQDNYTKNFQGEHARDAEEQALVFHEKALGALQKKWAENAFAGRYIQSRGVQYSLACIDSMRDYGSRQGEVYGDRLMANEEKNALQVMTNPLSTQEQIQAAYYSYHARSLAYQTQKGMPWEAAQEGLETFRRQAMAQLYQNKTTALMATDPAAAVQELGDAGNDMRQYLTRVQLLGLQSQAETRLTRRDAENATMGKAILANKGSELDRAVQTGDFSVISRMEQDCTRLGMGDEARDLQQSREVYEMSQGYIRESAGMPFTEQRAMLTTKFDEMALNNKEMAGAVNDMRDKALALADTRRKDFLKDPATYVMQNMPAGLEAAGTEEKARWLMSYQEAMAQGMPGFVPRVLSNDQARAISDKMNNPEVDARNKLDELHRVSVEYGGLTHRVLREVGVGNGAVVALRLFLDVPAKDSVTAENLLAAAQMKDSDIKTALTDGEIKHAMNKSDMMQYFGALQAAFPGVSDFVAQNAGIRGAASNLIKLQGERAMGPLDAAYDFSVEVDGDLKRILRLPRSSGENMGLVEIGLEVVTQNLKDYAPPHWTQEDVQAAKQRGIWTNMGGGEDFMLMVNGRSALRLPMRDVLRARNEYAEASFAAMAEAGTVGQSVLQEKEAKSSLGRMAGADLAQEMERRELAGTGAAEFNPAGGLE